MKHIFTFLLIFFMSNINAQYFNIIDDQTIPWISWEIDSSLTYSNEYGSVRFTSGKISYYSEVLNKQFVDIECSPMIFEIIYSVNNEINTRQNIENNQMRKKILFYEKYFGKLEGDMNDDCIQWIPVVKQPEFDPCIEVKK